MTTRWVFADLDGTLVDSLEVARSVLRRFLAERGRTDQQGEFESLNGRTLDEIAAALASTHALDESVSEIATAYRSMLDHAYEADVAPFDDATRVLSELRSEGVRLALVTAANRELTDRMLDRFGWTELFEVVVTGEDSDRAKPDPAPYRVALERSGSPPSDVVVIEDSPQGVAAARAAGLAVLTVGSTDTPTLSDVLERLR